MRCIIKICLLFTVLFSFSCQDEKDTSLFYKSDEQTILNYMIENKSKYSAFLEIMDRSEYSSFFGVYGNNTLFAFSNEAWDRYLKSKNMSSMADFTKNQLLELVMSHTINTGRVTSLGFKYGNLDQMNMLRGDLACSFGVGNEIFINSHKLLEKDVELINGVLFRIDGVIEPVNNSIGDQIQVSEGNSIFIEALEKTGLMDKLKAMTDNSGFATNYTVLVNPDAVYYAKGINNYSELLALFEDNATVDVTNSSSAFYQYVARHIIASKVFQNRFTSQLYKTLSTRFIDILIADGKFSINPDSPSPASLVLTKGNVFAKNGVYHILTSMLDNSAVKLKTQFYDFAEQPELLDWKLLNAGAWGRDSEEYVINGAYSAINTNCTQFFYYHSPGGAYDDLHNKDGMIAKSGNWYMDYALPSLPSGKYEVWMSVVKGHSAGAAVQCYWDGVKIGRIFGVNTDNSNRFIGGLPIDRWGVAGANFKFKQVINGRYTILSIYLGNVNVSREHVFGIKTVIDGLALIDRLEFIPIVEPTQE